MKKGPLAEAQVVRYLQGWWPLAERRVMGGARDRGDVAGIPDVVIEVKNERRMSLAEWVDEVEQEGRDAKTRVVFHKRVGRTYPGEWYVTMTGDQWVALMLRGEGKS